MLIVANPDSIPSRRASNLMFYYANTLGLNTTWQFFSPNPMGERYLEYEVHYDDEWADSLNSNSQPHSEESADEGMELEGEGERGGKWTHHYWPPRHHVKMSQEIKNRIFSHSVHSTLNETLAEDIFIPWVCRKHPKARSISLKAETKSLPSIEVAQINKKKFKFLAQSYELALKEFPCPRH